MQNKLDEKLHFGISSNQCHCMIGAKDAFGVNKQTQASKFCY